MMDWLEQNWVNVLASSLFGAGGIASLFLLFGKKWVSGWIDAKFATQLEKQRSDLAVMFDRKQRFYSKEYEVLPELWGYLNDAYVALKKATVALREVAFLEQYSSEDLDNLLNCSSNLSDQDKKQILSSSNKTETYSNILQWNEMVEAHHAYQVFNKKLSKNSIFLGEDIKEHFNKIDYMLFDIWSNRREGLRVQESKFRG